ncbi:enoyl-CoA hydratase/carnithine racemase [Bacillus aryabhattai]|jgi:enoyl-CoA hydratase|uniref:Enoyl-CoA hydratase/carnithine racemase n=1 Tax=Priestia aryabhattai TaxID=412384 RepID=A0A7W3RDT6_PRIAR|nr:MULTISPECIES: enoyl-CoA hydratase [Priestia]MBA9038300.1 enoyl-CoA hydratase/carnithine racemase [Priestia aryabhattai]QSX22840.1 enoyl-CoA hydratase [Priestia megaterium]
MMKKFVRVEKEEKTAIVTIDNPPLNVMSQTVVQQLEETYEELSKDPDVITIILTGAGERAFMAGADIKEFPQLMGQSGIKEEFMKTHSVLQKLENIEKPTIVVLNGLTFGGGCELSLTADIRIAEEHAQIGLPEVKLGLFPGGGGTQRLPRVIGVSKAKEWMFAGSPVSAEEALHAGFVNHVTPKGKGLEKAKELAKKFNRHSLPSLSRIKTAVNEGINRTLSEGLELEAELFEEVFQTEDIKEGVSAFIEKRPAVFSHK